MHQTCETFERSLEVRSQIPGTRLLISVHGRNVKAARYQLAGAEPVSHGQCVRHAASDVAIVLYDAAA